MRYGRIWLLLILGILLAPQVFSATRLGLHVTQEELNVWKQRAGVVPPNSLVPNATVEYRTAGDVQVNSPADWTRITGLGALLAGNVNQDNWAGKPAGSCYTAASGLAPGPGQGIHVLDAAFAYMVDPVGRNYGASVRSALVNQANTAGTQWSNTSIWCVQQLGDGLVWQIANWLTRYVFAYDYLKIADTLYNGGTPILSTADKALLDAWFSSAATYWARNVNIQITNNYYPHRADGAGGLSGTETLPYSTYINTNVQGGGQNGGNINYYNCTTGTRGPWSGSVSGFTGMWNNRAATEIRFATAAGIMTNNAFAKFQAQIWFKEWLTYANWPDGSDQEYSRWSDNIPTSPDRGYGYSGLLLGSMTSIADMFARNGDTSLYTYSTAAGQTTLTGPAGYTYRMDGCCKSLQHAIDTYYLFTNQRTSGVPGWYGTDDGVKDPGGPRCGNVDYLMQPDSVVDACPRVYDTSLSMANLFYNDANNKQIYLRNTSPASPAYPSNQGCTGGWNSIWEGEWGVYPGTLFMFGKQEGRVNPFGLTPAPGFTFDASTPVNSGSASTLAYGPVTDATSCTASIVSGLADTNWTGTSSATLITGAGSPKPGTPRTTSTTYRMSCTGAGGTTTIDRVVTIADVTPPSTVTGVGAVANSPSQITVSWPAASDNVAVTGYLVYRCTPPTCTTTLFQTIGNVLTFVDTGLPPSTGYSYQITAIDAAANESLAKSTLVSATTPAAPDVTAPLAPTGLIITVGSSTQLNLSWTAAFDAVGVTAYRVYRCSPPVCLTTTLTTLGNVLSHNDPGLTVNIAYSYQVTALDAAGNESPKSTLVSGTPIDTTNPSTVSGLNTSLITDVQIMLDWLVASDDVGIAGYNLYRCTPPTCTPTLYQTLGNVLSYLDTPLSSLTGYTYQVKARDAAGNLSAAFSNSVTATTTSTLVAVCQ